MSEVRDNLLYTAEHEWVEQAGGSCKIGITDYAQAALGDIVYVQMPKIGDAVEAGKVCGEVESTKSVSDIYSPVTGTVSAINQQLDSAPELLNSDPYGAGWIFEVSSAQLGTNMSASEYRQLIGE